MIRLKFWQWLYCASIMNKELINLPEDANAGIVPKILAVEGVSLEKRFTTGNSGCFVGKIIDAEGKNLVIKIPVNENSRQEIQENIQGYISLRQQGLQELLPETIRVKSFNSSNYLITTYLGNDFAYRAQNEPHPETLYQELVAQLFPIYKKTLKKNSADTDIFFHFIKNKLKKNFMEHIVPSGIVNKEELRDFLDINMYQLVTKKSCFAVFDFTPEDIYLQNGSLKYPDPKQNVRGNPIIDIACFAGVSRDVLNLSGSNDGYRMLQDFALDDVGSLFSLNREQSEKIFNLGRALQCSLSSRFRVGSEPEKARAFAMQSLEYLQLTRRLC